MVYVNVRQIFGSFYSPYQNMFFIHLTRGLLVDTFWAAAHSKASNPFPHMC